MKSLKTVILCNRSDYAIADAMLEQWFQDSVISSGLDYVYIANELQLTRLRIAVKEGKITPFKMRVEGESDDVVYKCDKHGKFDKWPEQLYLLNSLLVKLI